MRFDKCPSRRALGVPHQGEVAIAAPGATKRLKELARQQKQREKAEKREQRKREKSERPTPQDGVDPDIAGIVPGPQPPLEF
jgi:hypothetical protein